MGAVEEEIPVPVRGDDDGVALHGFVRDLLAHASETIGVVSLVEDEARKLDDTQIVESGDHGTFKGALRGGRARTPRGLCVSPEAAKEEVQNHEPAKEEGGDKGHKPYNAQQQVNSLQNPPAFRVSVTHGVSFEPAQKSGRPDSNRRPLGPQPSALPDCATSRRVVKIIPDALHAIIVRVARAATYIRTDPEGELPPVHEQREVLEAYAAREGYEIVARYEDLDAPGVLLYHRPGLKEAINNIKEEEDWEVLLVAHPRCVSDTESAIHEFVHKFSLYNNRLECPTRSWEEFLSAMKAYRREMSRR